jgi:hypothetical protein
MKSVDVDVMIENVDGRYVGSYAPFITSQQEKAVNAPIQTVLRCF